jgi:hypothetical protein
MTVKKQFADTDPDWFKQKLKARSLSMRSAAKFLGIDAAAVHHTIHGRRRMTIKEATEWADMLGVPRSDVMVHAGAGDFTEPEYVTVAYTVDRTGRVTPRTERARVPPPANSSDDTIAIRCEDPKSPNFGWLFFADKTGEKPRDLIGSLCLVDTGRDLVLGTILKGFSPASYSVGVFGADMVCDIEIEDATPVKWISTG